MADAFWGAWTRIRDELTPTYNKNEIPITPPSEGSSEEDVTLLHELSAGGRREPQLEKKSYVLPVPWMYTSARQLTLHSRVKFSCLNANTANMAVTKSGLIVQLQESNIILVNITGEVVRTFSVGLEFYLVAVDSKGLIWVCPYDLFRSELWCFTEEGKVVGVKKFLQKMAIEFVAFRGDDELVVIEEVFSCHVQISYFILHGKI